MRYIKFEIVYKLW